MFISHSELLHLLDKEKKYCTTHYKKSEKTKGCVHLLWGHLHKLGENHYTGGLRDGWSPSVILRGSGKWKWASNKVTVSCITERHRYPWGKTQHRKQRRMLFPTLERAGEETHNETGSLFLCQCEMISCGPECIGQRPSPSPFLISILVAVPKVHGVTGSLWETSMCPQSTRGQGGVR